MNEGGTYLRDPITGKTVRVMEATRPAPLSQLTSTDAVEERVDGGPDQIQPRKRGTSSHKEG